MPGTNDMQQELQAIRVELATMNANHSHTLEKLEAHNKAIGALLHWRGLIVGGLTVLGMMGGFAYHSFSGMLGAMLATHDVVTQQQVVVQDIQARLQTAESNISVLGSGRQDGRH